MDLPSYESALIDDPSHDYVRMDANSQNLYREAVEEIAARARRDPGQVAAAALALARERCKTTEPRDARRHLGYFLVAEGRESLEAALSQAAPIPAPRPRESRRVAWVVAGTLAGGALLCAATLPFFHLEGFGPATAILAASLLFLHALARALMIVGGTFARVTRPRHLPRLDFSATIPTDCLTAVCVPTMVTDRQHVADMAARVERHWRTIGDENVRIVLLTDWLDADQQEPSPDEVSLLADFMERIERLNASYGGGGRTPFYLLHRDRTYSRSEQRWMGWERKRGKLLQFNRLIAEGQHDFTRTVGDLHDLRRAVYAVIVDDNSLLTPGAIQGLVGTIAHPLGRLQRLDDGGDAMRGYGAMVPAIVRREPAPGQPTPGQTAPGQTQGPRARDQRTMPRQMSDARPAPQSGAASDGRPPRDPRRVLPRNPDFDVFGECKLPGQGLYDIRWAHRQLGQRFPEGCVLSHDVVESGFLRCGFDARTALVERVPETFRLAMEREHRWTRGDWQNVWVMFRLRPAAGETRARPGLLAWFWVFQNAIRNVSHVTFVALLVLLVGGDPSFADRRLIALLLLDRLPHYVSSGIRLVQEWPRRRRAPRTASIGQKLAAGLMLVRNYTLLFVRIHYVMIVRLATAFQTGLTAADAIVVSTIRLIRRRRLLEWISSAHLERGGRRYSRLAMYGWLAPVAAIGWAAWLWINGHHQSVGAMSVLALTALRPVGSWADGRLWSRPRSAGNPGPRMHEHEAGSD
jgi:cyclic beta-1,2-glucan synthetase